MVCNVLYLRGQYMHVISLSSFQGLSYLESAENIGGNVTQVTPFGV
jgi:hypothetical protein